MMSLTVGIAGPELLEGDATGAAKVVSIRRQRDREVKNNLDNNIVARTMIYQI